MFPQLGGKPHVIFIRVLLFAILLSPAVPVWGKSLKVYPQWLTAGNNNQSLKIIFDDPIFGNSSSIKFDLGEGIKVASHQFNSKEKTLFLKIKSVSKDTKLGPRPLIIKILSETTSPKYSKYNQIKSKIWIFSPGILKVDQSTSGKKNVIRLRITGKNSHFKKGF